MSCPSKKWFALNLFNWIDLLAILSYLTTVTISGSSLNDLFTFCRVLRLLRILKIGGHTKGMRCLGSAFKSSWKELLLLALMPFAAAAIFGTLAYRYEKDYNRDFKNLFYSYWWGIVTIATVKP